MLFSMGQASELLMLIRSDLVVVLGVKSMRL